VLSAYSEHAWTFIDRWPPAWRSISPATRMVTLKHRDVDYLLGADDRRTAIDLGRRVEYAMAGERRFVRLNSRSPKDVAGRDGPITASAAEAIEWLRASKSRSRPDLMALQSAGLSAHICLRDVIPDIVQHEYRCVVVGGRLIGAAHTQRRARLNPTSPSASVVLAKLDWLIEAVLMPDARRPEFVVDAFCPPGPRQAVMMIEINPLEGADTFGILD
jgi:hypothetical protein